MQNATKQIEIFLRDDGVTLEYPDGESAGYGLDGIIKISIGKNNNRFPRKIVLRDYRKSAIASMKEK